MMHPIFIRARRQRVPLLVIATLCGVNAIAPALVRGQSYALPALGSPAHPKVAFSIDRYYDNDGVGEIGRKMQAAHPQCLHLSSIGKSYQGRDLWLYTVTDFTTGNPDRKSGMYIDGNIHASEIQGTEVSMYTAWYLCEMAGHLPAVDTLLKEHVFYIVPSINPDGREYFLKQPNNSGSPRTGLAPRDDDNDGLVDEDGPDDLDGDGNITQMRRKNTLGKWKVSPDDPRVMIPVKPGERGEYDLLGDEGFDNDGDGLVDEDGPGYYDPNRNWPWHWQPRYIEGGSDYFPGSLPETRAVMAFICAHPNIAGAQSYHTDGGMILRGPGDPQDEYRPEDVKQYDAIGKVGEQILPSYRYLTVWKDLYIMYGGELDWLYGARGILTFSNELWTPFDYFSHEPQTIDGESVELRFDRLLLLGEAFVPWTHVKHPQYGDIEVGGLKKQYDRAVPGFLLPAEAHRNMAFTLFQASQLGQVRIDTVYTKALPGGLIAVTAVVSNPKLLATRSQQDVEHRITRPDWISLESATVLSGFIVSDPIQEVLVEQKRNPARIDVPTIPGHESVMVRWIVKGSGTVTVAVDSFKGGIVRRAVRL